MSDAAIDRLADKLLEITTSLQGPGLDIAREAARMQAFSNLWLDVAALIGGAWLARRGLAAFRADQEIDNGTTLAWIIVGTIGAIFAIAGGIVILDPWLWATMLHPEYWLAKKAIGL